MTSVIISTWENTMWTHPEAHVTQGIFCTLKKIKDIATFDNFYNRFLLTNQGKLCKKLYYVVIRDYLVL